MALNYTYVTDPLKVIESENVVFDFNVNEEAGGEASITKAVIMRSEPAGDYIHVIMPMNYQIMSFPCSTRESICRLSGQAR